MSNKFIPPLKKGTLSEFGYSSSLPEAQRRSTLLQAYKKYGGKLLIQKLNALAVLNKNRSVGRIFSADRAWASEMYAKNKM